MSKDNCLEYLYRLTNSGLIGIKTSFEDEGASFNDVVMLKDICDRFEVPITLKIGGAEALRDVNDAKILGIESLVAPMIESRYALDKFNNIADGLYRGINIETVTGIYSAGDIIKESYLNFVTIGRVDLVGSMGKDRSYVNSGEVFEITSRVLDIARRENIKCCVGGAISLDSYDFLCRLNTDGLLDKYETRYAIYGTTSLKFEFKESLKLGQLFELEWLKYKSQYYRQLSDKDLNRIKMIEERCT